MHIYLLRLSHYYIYLMIELYFLKLLKQFWLFG